MSRKEKHIKTTKLSLFQRYINREMKTGDEHVFERHLLNDSFESDALDGLSTLSKGEIDADISSITNKLDLKNRSIRSYPYWISAASIIVVLGIISLLWLMIPQAPLEVSDSYQPKDMEIASTTSEPMLKKDKSIDTKGDELSKSKEVIDDISTKARSTNEEKKINKILSVKVETEPSLSNMADVISVEDDEELEVQENSLLASMSIEEESEVVEKELAIFNDEIAGEKNIATSKISKKAAPVTVFSAINATDSTFPLVAAKKRQVVDQDSMESVTVSQNNLDYNINAKGESGLDDMQIVNKRFVDAEPIGGVEKYKHDIEQSLNYPENGSGKVERVVVLITIDEEGLIANVNVKRSPSDAFSAEIIRVIKGGPEWNSAIKDGLPVEEHVKLKFDFIP